MKEEEKNTSPYAECGACVPIDRKYNGAAGERASVFCEHARQPNKLPKKNNKQKHHLIGGTAAKTPFVFCS